MSSVAATADASLGAAKARRLHTRRLWRRNPALLFGAVMVSLAVLVAILAPFIAPYSPTDQNYSATVEAPSRQHPFGTDKFGRDQLSRVLYGARIDLSIGIICTIVPLMIGVAIGCVAGYFGGTIDTIFMRIIDIQVAFPFYVLLIAIIAVLGTGLVNMYYTLILVGWVAFARLIRSEVLLAKNMEYTIASRALGCRDSRIIVRHIVPNVIGSAVIFAMSAVVLSILAAASLGFLGLGVQAPKPEWGVMIADSREYMTTAWWLPFFPGAAVALVGISFSLLGDGLTGLLRRRDR